MRIEVERGRVDVPPGRGQFWTLTYMQFTLQKMYPARLSNIAQFLVGRESSLGTWPKTSNPTLTISSIAYRISRLALSVHDAGII